MRMVDSHVRDADTGDIIVGWLVRVVALLAVAGVMSFDALSIGTSRLSIEDQAKAAARAAAETWSTSRNAQSAFDSAWRSATEANATNEVSAASFSIDPSGAAHVVVSREAPTFVVRLIGPLRQLAVVRSEAVGKAPTL